LSRYERSHTELVGAPAKVVYQLVADVKRWPAVFGPTIYVDYLWQDDAAERFQIWASVNGEVKTWTSRRELDSAGLHITFEQERSQAPIASMGGSWTFRETGPSRCEIELRHHFTAVDDDPGAVEWISTALDANSAAELGALRRIAESGHRLDEVLFGFEDVVRTEGPAAEIYEFIRRGDLWAERLPHVRAVQMTEDAAGVQQLTMETRTADGSAHATSSTRLLLSGNRIVYKQHVLPALLNGHSGQWTVDDAGGTGTVITARHVVALRPESVTGVMGPDRTLADARAFIREALGANSQATLEHACAYALSLAEQR
jgi:aromatase